MTTAPKTSTAVTSIACARASAAYQVATYAREQQPGQQRPAPLRQRRDAVSSPSLARDGEPADEQQPCRAPIRAAASVRGGMRAQQVLDEDDLDRPEQRRGEDHRLAAAEGDRAGAAGEPGLAGEQAARSRARAASRSAPCRSGTASSATQTTSVFWMNAACVASARASPSKKRTNGTLPPITATREQREPRARPASQARATRAPRRAAARAASSDEQRRRRRRSSRSCRRSRRRSA